MQDRSETEDRTRPDRTGFWYRSDGSDEYRNVTIDGLTSQNVRCVESWVVVIKCQRWHFRTVETNTVQKMQVPKNAPNHPKNIKKPIISKMSKTRKKKWGHVPPILREVRGHGATATAPRPRPPPQPWLPPNTTNVNPHNVRCT